MQNQCTKIQCIPVHYIEIQKKKWKKIILFAIAMKIIKYLRINLIKDVKNLYNKNYKNYLKKNEKDTNKWKNTLYSQIGRINIV